MASGGFWPPDASFATTTSCDYWLLLQQADVALARSQPSTQHSQVHALHLHSPVSQQPQQSHLGQPALLTLTAAAPNGTTARAAQRNRLFIVESPYRRELNSETPYRNTRYGQAHLLPRAIRQEGGRRLIQFRQTPYKMRGGRCGMVSPAESANRVNSADDSADSSETCTTAKWLGP